MLPDERRTGHGKRMDKNTIIAKIAQESEDKLLLARILDKYEQMERRGIPTATAFLSQREQLLAQTLLNTAGIRTGFRFDGGYEDAERKLLLYSSQLKQLKVMISS